MATQYQNYKENLVSVGGNATVSIPSGAANTVITASTSRLCRIVVTTTGSGAGNVQFFDNATTNSGTVLFALPANAAAAQFYDVQMPAVNGIVCQNVASGPVLTVSFL